jgi:phosphohistidine phosphatase
VATRRRLTLLRHAKASWEDPALPDRERPLNKRGQHDAPMMGQRLRAGGARPSLILTSPAVRALHTARIVAREINYPLEFLQREADLYLATPEEILQVIARQDNSFKDILVCGHNPGLTELANLLTGADIDNIPTCGVVIIEAELEEWSGLGRRRGSLVGFDYPKRPDSGADDAASRQR